MLLNESATAKRTKNAGSSRAHWSFVPVKERDENFSQILRWTYVYDKQICGIPIGDE